MAQLCWDYNYSNAVKSAWIENPIVLEEINRRMTGTAKFWLNWVFEDYLCFRPRRMLSIGCGDGEHELIVARNRYVGTIDAFDASNVGIELASKKAQSEGFDVNFYVDTFEHFTIAPVNETYDLIMFAGSLHHVRELEPMLNKVRNVLAPDGVILFNEYIGPCYGIYEADRVELINRTLAALAPEFKTSPDARFVNPSIEMVLARDPTEGVRSALIPNFLEIYFKTEWIRYFGGALLHPMFPYLNSQRLSDKSPESESILRLLIDTERSLTEAGKLKSDFCFGFCGHRDLV
jgi:2-polyprenyl-3-methyl-5-hydroxy-6-metoxy-1,4-benzoquinol methylase